jgi:hypothetical protein
MMVWARRQSAIGTRMLTLSLFDGARLPIIRGAPIAAARKPVRQQRRPHDRRNDPLGSVDLARPPPASRHERFFMLPSASVSENLLASFTVLHFKNLTLYCATSTGCLKKLVSKNNFLAQPVGNVMPIRSPPCAGAP